jgi:hypothetical protein
MDVSPFSTFKYADKDAWHDFLLVNAAAHTNYNTALELLGKTIAGYPIADIGETKEAEYDWLQSHYLMHKNLAATLGLPDLPDMTDVEMHDDSEFNQWLQQHQQQHQMIDSVLNL